MCQTQGWRAKSGLPHHFIWAVRACKDSHIFIIRTFMKKFKHDPRLIRWWHQKAALRRWGEQLVYIIKSGFNKIFYSSSSPGMSPVCLPWTNIYLTYNSPLFLISNECLRLIPNAVNISVVLFCQCFMHLRSNQSTVFQNRIQYGN